MDAGLSDSELKVMNVIWQSGGEVPARAVVDALSQSDGLSASAAYTLVYRCIKKGAVERVDPGFVCRSKVSRQEVQDEQTDSLVSRLFDGSVDKLFSALIDRRRVSAEEVARLRSSIENYGRHFE